MSIAVLYSIAFLVGLLAGIAISIIFHGMQRTSGTLRIDRSNPEKDVYRFDIDKLDNLHEKKRIVLKIDPNADLSQE